ncbi:MAG: DUF2145 domain-containing protein [Pseudomonadota bacterium]
MIRALLLLIALLTAPLAHAGSSQASDPILPAADVAAFSNRVQQDLASRGAHVAIVARMGRDPSSLPPGIRYTHLGFWVFSEITRPDGTKARGYRVYNLYQMENGGTRSALVQDSPADFFSGATRLDAGIIIPDPRLQKKLIATIASPAYRALHNPHYSVLSNPRDTRFQNCTEHTLDILMASLYGTADRARIKANIAAHFTPQRVEVDGLKRLFAPVASQALTTADHGAEIRTATFGSIARFMQAHALTQTVYTLTPTAAHRF